MPLCRQHVCRRCRIYLHKALKPTELEYVALELNEQDLTSRQEPFALDVVPLLHFVLFAFLSCPPNYLWQEFLEKLFPGYTIGSDGQKTLHKTNTAKKFMLDQTLAATVNILLFISVIGAFKGKGGKAILRDCRRVCFAHPSTTFSTDSWQDFWPIARSGLKLWPLVSLFNFAFVPLPRRTVVGSLVGLFWGVYLSLLVSDDSH
jgi:protein Mpv17